MLIMSIWALSPFIALFGVSLISTYWLTATRNVLYIGMIVLSLLSLAVYTTDAIRQPKPQAAFVFVTLPPASFLFIAALFVFTKLYRR